MSENTPKFIIGDAVRVQPHVHITDDYLRATGYVTDVVADLEFCVNVGFPALDSAELAFRPSELRHAEPLAAPEPAPEFAVGDYVRVDGFGEAFLGRVQEADLSWSAPYQVRPVGPHPTDRDTYPCKPHELTKLQSENRSSIGHARNHPTDAPEQLYPIDQLGSPIFSLTFDARTLRASLVQGTGKYARTLRTWDGPKALASSDSYAAAIGATFAREAAGHIAQQSQVERNGRTVAQDLEAARKATGRAPLAAAGPAEDRHNWWTGE